MRSLSSPRAAAQKHVSRAMLLSLAIAPVCHATITRTVSGSNWTISNGALTVVYASTSSKFTSVKVAGHSDNILDPNNSQLYPELAKSGLDAAAPGPLTNGFQQTANYIDFWSNTASSAGEGFSYQIHYVMFDNDPAIHIYQTVNHSSTDIASSYGQGQFLMRVDPTKFSTLYQVNTSINNIGTQITRLPSTTAELSELNGVKGYGGTITLSDGTTKVNPRLNIDEVLDLAGDDGHDGQPDLISLIGRPYLNKYDYSSYEQLHQAQTEYGPTYAISNIVDSHETFSGGPTKQNLQFTNNILMTEFLSGHYGATGYSYVPPQGVDSSKFYGPYTFRITTTDGKTGAQLYSDAINSAAGYTALYDSDTTMVANGYVPSTQRGAFAVHIDSPVGWNSDVNKNTIVLSDPNKNFQKSTSGYNYWTQVDTNGNAVIGGIVPSPTAAQQAANGSLPATYRLSIYQYGQWGETRYDNVQIVGNKINMPQNLKFVPENFSKAAPIFTVGTPDRSAHEFLNGHNPDGTDKRDYWGSYNYWQEEEDLGNPGKVVYYGTNVPGHAATNDPNKWLANQWNVFNPALYDYSTNSNINSGGPGLYKSAKAPAYVGDPATYRGTPWEVHFAVTDAQKSQGNFVVLSLGIAGTKGSMTVNLNNPSTTGDGTHTRVWHSHDTSDPMDRSGEAGFYQWVAFEWPTTLLSGSGLDNILTFSASQNDGLMYDALRLEIGDSANPNLTGWSDYDYINSNASTNAALANDALGLSLVNNQVPEPSSLLLLACLVPLRRRRRIT